MDLSVAINVLKCQDSTVDDEHEHSLCCSCGQSRNGLPDNNAELTAFAGSALTRRFVRT